MTQSEARQTRAALSAAHEAAEANLASLRAMMAQMEIAEKQAAAVVAAAKRRIEFFELGQED